MLPLRPQLDDLPNLFYLMRLSANFTTCSTGIESLSFRIDSTTFALGAGEKPNIVSALTASSRTVSYTHLIRFLKEWNMIIQPLKVKITIQIHTPIGGHRVS